MEKGNYDYPLGIRRRDELGYLADRFVDMRQRERAYLDSLEHVTRVNLNGVFFGLRHVLPVMLAQGRGAIVNTASIGS